MYNDRFAKGGTLTNKKYQTVNPIVSHLQNWCHNLRHFGKRTKLHVSDENDLSSPQRSEGVSDMININSQSSKEINCYQLADELNPQQRNDGTSNNCSFHNTLSDINCGTRKFCLYSNGAHAVCFDSTVTSYSLFESLFSQLQNALSFESKAAHLRSRGHGKEKVHVFYSSNFR